MGPLLTTVSAADVRSEAQTPRAAAVPLCCPDCLGRLGERRGQLACAECGREFPVRGGIAMLRSGNAEYFGEFPQAEMARLLEDASRDPESALRCWLRKKQAPSRLGEYILGAGRAGWKFLLPIRQRARVLDLGCGWGALAHSLAQSCRSVVAMDSTLQRMHFLRLCAAREGIDGLQFVCGGDGKYLPFEDRTFDLVLLNGVLEWVPSGRQGNPQMVQLEFLREVRRILSDSGALYLGIENRFAWKTWFRQPDGHTGLRFVAWMPRRLAELYSRLNGSGPYRNYLYGRRGYETLLQKAGYENTDFYVPLPGYHYPASMVPASRKRRIAREATGARLGRRRLRSWARGFLASHFPDAYGMVAGGREASPSFLQRLVAHVKLQLPSRLPDDAEPVLYRINGEMGMVTAVITGSHASHAGLVLKLPLYERAETGLRGEARWLAGVGTRPGDLAPLQKWLPECLLEGTFEEQYYAVFGVLPGVDVRRLRGRCGRARQAREEAARFAVSLHRCSEQFDHDTDWTQTLSLLVDENIGLVASIAPTRRHEEALARLADTLKAAWSAEKPRVVLSHGDFKLANCLFDPSSGRLTGVLDWGARLERELPLYDLSFLLVDSLATESRSTHGEVLGRWLQPTRHDSSAYRWMAAYAGRLGIAWNETRLPALAAYQWLKRMAPLGSGHETRRFDYRYVDSMFDVLLCSQR